MTVTAAGTMPRSPSTAPHATRSKGWHVSLWVVQGLLALAFGMTGLLKATRPIAELAQMMIWPGTVPAALVRFIGIAELAGAVGLILPAATRIRPSLTPWAAAGLALVVGLAVPFHAWRGEFQVLPVNLTLLALAAFVAWGRFRRAPVAAR